MSSSHAGVEVTYRGGILARRRDAGGEVLGELFLVFTREVFDRSANSGARI